MSNITFFENSQTCIFISPTTGCVTFSSEICGPPKYSKTKIKKIRSGLGLSHSVFASIFGVTASAVQHWEQGLRSMPAPACRLLDLIEKDPNTIFSLISNDKGF